MQSRMSVPSVSQSLLYWDKLITGAAVTSVTTNGEVTLNGNAHGGYDFEFYVVNGAAALYGLNLYVNNDQTAGNYRTVYWASNVPTGPGLVSGAYVMTSAASQRGVSRGLITISPDGYLIVKSYRSEIFAGPDIRAGTNDIYKTATITNLTRIDLIATANGIGINSRFRLWRRI